MRARAPISVGNRCIHADDGSFADLDGGTKHGIGADVRVRAEPDERSDHGSAIDLTTFTDDGTRIDMRAGMHARFCWSARIKHQADQGEGKARVARQKQERTIVRMV
jgi:hypothetical protein